MCPCQRLVVEAVAFGNGSVHNVIGRLVMRLQKDCQEIGQFVTQERDRLASFRAFVDAAEAGAPIPPVAADDLRCLHSISVDMTKRYVGKNGVIRVELTAGACSRGANLPVPYGSATPDSGCSRGRASLQNGSTTQSSTMPCTEWPRPSPRTVFT